MSEQVHDTYEPPTISELGSLHSLTLLSTTKTSGFDDGFSFDPDGSGPNPPVPIGSF